MKQLRLGAELDTELISLLLLLSLPALKVMCFQWRNKRQQTIPANK